MAEKIKQNFFETNKKFLLLLSYVLVLTVALVCRLMFINKPERFIFDEVHYVPYALSLYQNGYGVKWFNFEKMGYGFQAAWDKFQDLTPYSYDIGVSHPPLGAYLIGLTTNFAPLEPIMWRIPSAIFGVLTVIAVMLISWELFKNHFATILAGTFMALSNLNIAMSNVALLDIFLTFFTLMGVLFTIKYLKNLDFPVKVFNLNLIFALIFFGLAASVKWSALYYILVFALFILIKQILTIAKTDSSTMEKTKISLYTLIKNIAASLIVILVYVAWWVPTIINYHILYKNNTIFGGIHSFIEWHVNKLSTLSNITSGHRYSSGALEWITASRPVKLIIDAEEGMFSIVSSMPNLVMWFTGLLAILILTITLTWKRNLLLMVLPLGFIAGWAPWLMYPDRTMFQFYTATFEPYLIISLVWLIISLRTVILKATLVLLVVTNSIFFYPTSSGMPVLPISFSYKFHNFWYEFMIKNNLYDVTQLDDEAYKEYSKNGLILEPRESIEQSLSTETENPSDTSKVVKQ